MLVGDVVGASVNMVGALVVMMVGAELDGTFMQEKHAKYGFASSSGASMPHEPTVE